jgi:SH3-like domain-containing protein
VAEVRQGPNEQSDVRFRAQQGVALDLTEISTDGWARVRHRDGDSGYIRINAIWGH